jgi:D-alanine-D-alanine ligase
LKKSRINFAFLSLHGSFGEDGTVQGLLEVMNIPYSGCGVLASALAMDKIYSKRIFDSFKLSTPSWKAVRKGEKLPALPSFPVVVKPATQGSAIGVSIVKKRADLIPALTAAFKHDPNVLVEQFIPGTELTVGIVGNEVLPVIEIVPEHDFYDFESKYKPGMSRHIIPPRLPKNVIRAVEKLAFAAFNALGCRAVSRIDIIVDKKGKPWLLEANTIPGMTETSLLPDAARAAGYSFSDLVLKIVEYSLIK